MGEKGGLRAVQKRQLMFCALAVFPTALQSRNHLALLGNAKLSLRDLPVRRRSPQFADQPISVVQMEFLDLQELRQQPDGLTEKGLVAITALQPRDNHPLARDAGFADSDVSFGGFEMALNDFLTVWASCEEPPSAVTPS